MRCLLILIVIIGLTFISCDGRYRAYESNQDILKKHHLYKSFSENVTYIPEAYSENTTDTLLSNGFHVKIKTITDMKTSYLNEFIKDTMHYKNYYRTLKTFIIVSNEHQEIASKLITKDFFIHYDNHFEKVLKDKVVQGVWLNQYESNKTNQVVLDVIFSRPASKNLLCYKVTLNNNGSLLINKESESKTI